MDFTEGNLSIHEHYQFLESLNPSWVYYFILQPPWPHLWPLTETTSNPRRRPRESSSRTALMDFPRNRRKNSLSTICELPCHATPWWLNSTMMTTCQTRTWSMYEYKVDFIKSFVNFTCVLLKKIQYSLFFFLLLF